ncbi:MAG TPA: hypothetical protein VG125_00160 [Pirellulales bacterium]|jgi:hypothetical protein|nr:hypothetical protein [Pirellulales bacterium]
MANNKPTKTHGPTVLPANVTNIVGELHRLVAVAGVAAAAGKRRKIDCRSLVIRGK